MSGLIKSTLLRLDLSYSDLGVVESNSTLVEKKL